MGNGPDNHAESIARERTGSDSRTLLVIDDSALSFRVATTFLSRKAIRIHTARHGENALEKARALKPDLILLDLVMPGSNNEEICRQLKQNPDTAHIPVIIAGSDGEFQERGQLLESGCQALLFKPLKRKEFLSVIEDYLNITPREQTRVRTNLPCTVSAWPRTASCRSEAIDARIRSLSLTGAFVEMNPRYEMERGLIEIVLTTPEWRNKVRVEACVVWIGRLGNRGGEGIGVKFLPLQAIETELIRRQIKQT